TFAKQAVPQPADLGGVDAAKPVGAAADRAVSVGTRAAVNATLGHMTRRFDAEGDGWAGVVEVPEVLDVITVAAVGIERTCAFGMGRDRIGLQRVVFLQPLDARDGLLMTQGAIVVDVILARPDLPVAGVQQTDRIVVTAVEAILVFSHFVG